MAITFCKVFCFPWMTTVKGATRQEETPRRSYKINGFRSSTSRAARQTFSGSSWALPMRNTFPWAVSAMKQIFEFCFPPSPQNMWFQAAFVARMHCYHLTRWLAIGISSEKENVTGTSRGNTYGRVWGRVVGNDPNKRRWSYWDQQLNPALEGRLQVQSPDAGCPAGRRSADWKSETSSWCYPAKSMSFLPLVGTGSHISSPDPEPPRGGIYPWKQPRSLFRLSATPLAWWTYREERAWDSLEDASGLQMSAQSTLHAGKTPPKHLKDNVRGLDKARERPEGRKGDDGSAAGKSNCIPATTTPATEQLSAKGFKTANWW